MGKTQFDKKPIKNVPDFTILQVVNNVGNNVVQLSWVKLNDLHFKNHVNYCINAWLIVQQCTETFSSF